MNLYALDIHLALRSSDVDTKNNCVWYTWHAFRFTMRLLVKKGTSQRPLFVGKTQEYVDTEDFICAMMQHAKPCGSINNVFIDFENTQILVSHVAEVRVVAQLAAAYYNATLAQNLSCQKDLYGTPYTTAETPCGAKETPRAPTCTPFSVASAKQTCADDAAKVKCTVKISPAARTAGLSGRNSHKKTYRRREQQEVVWDEEMHGDRLVYDNTYEINEHLVPWLMNPQQWEEK